jgi:chromosomal replication initiation ATPase DnaA
VKRIFLLKFSKSIVTKNIQYDDKLSRRLVLYCSRKYTQKTLKEIGEYYGNISDTGVSQACKRMELAREKIDHLMRINGL